MKNILVTGGAGNIGSALVEALVKNVDFHVVVIDNLITGNVKKMPANAPNLTFIKADVNDYKEISAIMLAYKFDYVFHYAALVGVKRTLDNPVMVLNDINGIRNVLDLAKYTSVKRVFYSSSSEVYGEPVEFPQNEFTTPLNSRLPYAVVKNIGESFLKSYHKEYGQNFTIFRFFNTYGPKQSEDFVVSKFIHLALADKDITLYGDGMQTRTFCYIEDNIEVTLKTLMQNLCINEVLNVGNDQEYTIKELAEHIISLTNSKSKIIHLPPLEEGDMTRRKPDIERMRKVIDRNLTPLQKGLELTIQSFR
jgi:nucleoside-diphosphate-sugar epimerase